MGWPDRPGRDDFVSGDIEDEKRVADPITQVGAGVFNLAMWNTAGIGLTAPKFAMIIEPDVAGQPGLVKSGGFAWDVASMFTDVATGSMPWFTYSHTVTGTIEITWQATAARENGDLIPLTFTAAQAQVCWPDGVTAPVPVSERNARASVENAGQVMTVTITRAAGATPYDAPFILMGW